MQTQVFLLLLLRLSHHVNSLSFSRTTTRTTNKGQRTKDSFTVVSVKPDANSEDEASSFLVSRRDASARLLVTSSCILSSTTTPTRAAFWDSRERRQKELCIVSILRLKYWAMNTATQLETVAFPPTATGDIVTSPDMIQEEQNRKKNVYLEARLGAKAMVAEKQKVGGGASYRVFLLAGLQLRPSLEDLSAYLGNSKEFDACRQELIESLASIVEFDGLETTQDPSPRSSLTLSQYNERKAVFVRRLLNERVVILADQIVDFFEPSVRAQCEEYVQEYYPTELPPSFVLKPTTTVASNVPP